MRISISQQYRYIVRIPRTDIGPQIDTDPEDLLGNNYAIWGNLLKFVTEGGSRNILTWTPRIKKQKK
jgi:hypothetical protein